MATPITKNRKVQLWMRNIMFACMRKNGFDQTESIKDFRRACKKKGIPVSEATCYRYYDRIATDVDMTGVYQQNINQYFTHLTQICSKAAKKYLQCADDENASYRLDDYLRVAELQTKALNLQQTKNGDNNNIFMQFLQQNNNQEVNINEVFQNITEGLAEFGPVIQRLKGTQTNPNGGAIPTISTTFEAKDPN